MIDSQVKKLSFAILHIMFQNTSPVMRSTQCIPEQMMEELPGEVVYGRRVAERARGVRRGGRQERAQRALRQRLLAAGRYIQENVFI